MQLTFEHHGVKYVGETNDAKSIAIELQFNGPQPNHFGAAKATRSSLELGGFIGDIGQGGSCNVDTLKMVPHCNGTHTETVRHIVDSAVAVAAAAMDVLSVALVVTVKPVLAKQVTETYRPKLDNDDSIITGELLHQAINRAGDVTKVRPEALIVRTLPNGIDKCRCKYSGECPPPFFTVEAMQLINDARVKHLMVDFPSIDRMSDDGCLTNHHLFWNVVEQSHELSSDTLQEKTITEMIYVEDAIADGVYALNLQVPAFCSDAAPSRPLILPIEPIEQ